ncbi:MAG TPA: PBP1A family penicillin-binding protein [Gemmatimonadota bacterium]|nr:PBP1A family penicillin-binding protein [Gemmatimonadota bacterium]
MAPRKDLGRLWRGANVVALIALFLLFMGVGAFAAVYQRVRSDLPSIARLEDWRPSLVTQVYSRDGELIAEFAAERREIVPLDRVPRAFIDAVLATEDRAFFEHDGVNVRRALAAAWYNLVTGSRSQGASTITMQLSRNLFLSPDKLFTRKFKEVILANEIEEHYPKQRILEMYVNQVYFGSGAYGIESAAQLYFGKHATELTLPEAALLAGIVQAPSRQSPRVSLEAATARRAAVLANMVEVGAIEAEDAESAERTAIELVPERRQEGAHSYFAEHVRRQLESMLGTDAVWRGGYIVHTTLDTRLQQAAEEIVERHIGQIERTLAADKVRREAWQAVRAADSTLAEAEETESRTATPYLQGALVAMDLETGGIVAMVGGRSFDESKFNRITQAHRQPGSVFKPFVYSAAIRTGFPASYVVQDRPLSMPMGNGTMWRPENYDRSFRGPINLRRALTQSINVATVRLMFDVGIRPVIDYARDAGITTDLPPFGSLALGAADLIPYEVLRAYTIFPTGGVRVTPISISRIEDRNGNVIRSFQPARARVLTPQEAYIMTSILEDVVDHGTGRYAIRGSGFTWPAGGKTGTTNESTDAWFVGFTTRYHTLTWVGFDRKQRIRYNGTGGVLAAPIWADFMKVAHEGLEAPEPEEGFPRPPGLVERAVTTTTGMLAADFCGMGSYTEIFIPETVPEHFCRLPRGDVPLLDLPEEEGEGKEDPQVGDDFLF